MHDKLRSIVMLAGLLGSSLAMAHGEDKLGPNQGFVRMPGPFHTEVVPAGNTFKVFLLDISFKDATTADSTVAAMLKQGKVSTELACAPAGDFFSCVLPKGATLNEGLLEVKASRLGAPSQPALYTLPLRLNNSAGAQH